MPHRCRRRRVRHDPKKGKHPGEKGTFLSRYQLSFDILSEKLRKIHNISLYTFRGAMSQDARLQALLMFRKNTQADRTLLVTIASGGVNLNIMAATVVVFLEPMWKKDVEDQAFLQAMRIPYFHVTFALVWNPSRCMCFRIAFC